MYIPRIKEKYFQVVVPSITKEARFKSPMQVPRLQKICINQGVGRAITNSKLIDIAIDEISLIAGQKAIPRKAKKSVSNFKLREGVNIGAMVTLRGNRMYEFFDRLVSVALPRVKDFNGLKTNCFDGSGNYTIGIKEQIIFPEISIDKVTRITGMNITFVTSTNRDDHAFMLLKTLGMPFKITK